MLFKLAFRNVKRQISNYLIYFITVTLTVAMIFSFNNMIYSEAMNDITKEEWITIKNILLCVSFMLSVVVAFVLSYATAFLLKRRKKEFGLYLTLGMTRVNILVLFMGETLVTFLFSLGFGMLLGMGAFQGLMAIFLNIIDLEYTVSSYSPTGSLITAVMVMLIFLVASIASLGYLRFAKISKLLHGDKTVEKTVKYPAVWLIVSLAAVGLLTGSLVLLTKWIAALKWYSQSKNEIIGILIMFVGSAILLPLGIAKGAVPLCIKRNEKTLSAKGTAVFTMRQLSGRLNANSIMTGVITFLLLFAVIAPNMFLLQTSLAEADAKSAVPFEVKFSKWILSETAYEAGDYENELRIVSEYAKIDETYQYVLYRIPCDLQTGIPEEFRMGCAVVAESSYNKLCSMLGRRTLKLNGGFYAIYGDKYTDSEDFSEIKFTIDGASYSNTGSESWALDDWAMLNNYSGGPPYALVVPDAALENTRELIPYSENVAVSLKNSHYNARKLYRQLMSDKSSDVNVTLQEYVRLSYIEDISLWLISCMFIAVTFMLLSMAMLALKMLTMLEEDKQRYRTLWRLGAEKRVIAKSLFSQMFFYYFLPFALPLILTGPMCLIMLKLLYAWERTWSITALICQAVGVIGVLAVLYALFFTATYLIARRDVKKTLQSVG